MPDSTSQSPPEGFGCSSTTDQWSQELTVPNGMNIDWAQPIPNLRPDNYINTEYVSHDLQSPPHYNVHQYINMPQPRAQPLPTYHPVHTGQVLNRPIIIHRPTNGHAANWINQPIGRLVQPGPLRIKNGVKKQKRIRTAFTSHQMMELEQEYTKTKYLDRTRRLELADTLRLNERTIKIWFQNRRMKEKKDRADSLEEVEEVNSTESPELVPVVIQEPCQNNRVYQRQEFVEHYPVSSTSAPQLIAYPGYAVPEGYHGQIPGEYGTYISESQELSPDSTAQPEVPHVQCEMDEKNWDLSWIRSIQAEGEEEYQ